MGDMITSTNDVLRATEDRLARLEAHEESEWRVAAGAGTSDPPADAELDALYGLPADLPEGFRAAVESATNQWYIAFTANGAWQVIGAGGGGIGAYWALLGNAGTNPAVNFVGTTDAQDLQLRVGGTRALLVEYTGAGTPNLIGGYNGNTSGVLGNVTGGGGSAGLPNVQGNRFSVIGGGEGNQSNGLATGRDVISGGQENEIRGDAGFNVIGGGQENVIEEGGVPPTAFWCVIGGGYKNHVEQQYNAIGGGYANEILGNYATIPGGMINSAVGDCSFAAGRQAKAIHDGAFVLADNLNADHSSQRAAQLRGRFAGGFGSKGDTDNYGEFRFWAATTAVSGVAQTIVDGGTDDVTGILMGMYTCVEVTGGGTGAGTVALVPGTSWNLYNDGTDTLTLYVNAGGDVTVQRTAGADTFKVAVLLLWI